MRSRPHWGSSDSRSTGSTSTVARPSRASGSTRLIYIDSSRVARAGGRPGGRWPPRTRARSGPGVAGSQGVEEALGLPVAVVVAAHDAVGGQVEVAGGVV